MFASSWFSFFYLNIKNVFIFGFENKNEKTNVFLYAEEVNFLILLLIFLHVKCLNQSKIVRIGLISPNNAISTLIYSQKDLLYM